MSTSANLRASGLKELRPVKRRDHIPLGAHQELEDMLVTRSMAGPTRLLGERRCNALGLLRGDCQGTREANSVYCYYHTKVAAGLLESTGPLYSVWPLPPYRWRLPEVEFLINTQQLGEAH